MDEHRRLAGERRARPGPGPGRHHHGARGGARLLLPADPRRPRRGRAADRRHLVAVPRGGEPPARPRRSSRSTSRPRSPRAAALLREGVPEARIEVTGNTVIDALLMELARQESRRSARPGRRASSAALLGRGLDARRPLVLDHRPPAGELRRRHPPDLRGHRRSWRGVIRTSLRVPGAPEPEGQGRGGPAAGRPAERAADPAAGLPELRGPDGPLPRSC